MASKKSATKHLKKAKNLEDVRSLSYEVNLILNGSKQGEFKGNPLTKWRRAALC
jgi:hypothetical protein